MKKKLVHKHRNSLKNGNSFGQTMRDDGSQRYVIKIKLSDLLNIFKISKKLSDWLAEISQRIRELYFVT